MRRAVVLAGLLLATVGAVARQPRVELAPSEALGCLSPAAAQRGDAMRVQVQSLRVPCLAAGAPPAVVGIDDVVRKDDRSVHWLQPTDGDQAERAGQPACLRPPEPPAYPGPAMRAEMQADRRPHLPNAGAEIGSADAACRPLRDWLAQVAFDLPAAMPDAVDGETAPITVPRLKIDLYPTGVTS
jgi:hypothetical protein